MANNEFTIPIPARLKNVAKGGHVAGAKDIIDDTLGKEQSVINQERIDDIAKVKGGGTKSIADLSEDIANEAERASGIEASLRESIDELGHIGLNPENAISTDGDDFAGDTVEKRSKIPTIGAIKDGADDEPTAGSDNLVKSGGVKNELNKINSKCYAVTTEEIAVVSRDGIYVDTTGRINTYSPYCISSAIDLKKGDIISVRSKANDVVSAIAQVRLEYPDKIYIPLVIGISDDRFRQYTFEAKENCSIVLTYLKTDGATYVINHYPIIEFIDKKNVLRGITLKAYTSDFDQVDTTNLEIGDWGYNYYGKCFAVYTGNTVVKWDTRYPDNGTLAEYNGVLYVWDGTDLNKYTKGLITKDDIYEESIKLALSDSNFLNLSDGISQEDVENGTSKYDVIREGMSDTQLINSAVSVFYNLRKLVHEGKSIYTFGSEWSNICIPDATPELSTYYDYNNGVYSPKSLEDTVIQAPQINVLHPKLVSFEMMMALDEWWDNYGNDGTYDPNNIHRCAKYYNSYIAIIKKAYKEWGAIPILTYHMGNPYMTTSTLGSAVIIPEHPNVVSEILNNTGTVCGRDLEYANPKAYFESRITKLANFVKELKDENNNPIPVIIRLFHEMDAMHNWWGVTRCSDSEYVTFVRYFKNAINAAAGTHNIMWTYSTTYHYRTVGEIYKRYPGNDCIDIVGFDMYNAAAKQYDSSLNGWETFEGFCKLGREYTAFAKINGKVFGLDEFGDATTGRILINSGTYFNNILFKFLKSIGNECSYVCGYGGYCIPTEQAGINDRNKFISRKSIIKYDATIDGNIYDTNVNLVSISELFL